VKGNSSKRSYRSRVRALVDDFARRGGSDLQRWRAEQVARSAGHPQEGFGPLADTKIALALPSGAVAELHLPSGHLTAADAEALGAQLRALAELWTVQGQAKRHDQAAEATPGSPLVVPAKR
jgi:hypothetical protein